MKEQEIKKKKAEKKGRSMKFLLIFSLALNVVLIPFTVLLLYDKLTMTEEKMFEELSNPLIGTALMNHAWSVYCSDEYEELHETFSEKGYSEFAKTFREFECRSTEKADAANNCGFFIYLKSMGYTNDNPLYVSGQPIMVDDDIRETCAEFVEYIVE